MVREFSFAEVDTLRPSSRELVVEESDSGVCTGFSVHRVNQGCAARAVEWGVRSENAAPDSRPGSGIVGSKAYFRDEGLCLDGDLLKREGWFQPFGKPLAEYMESAVCLKITGMCTVGGGVGSLGEAEMALVAIFAFQEIAELVGVLDQWG